MIFLVIWIRQPAPPFLPTHILGIAGAHPLVEGIPSYRNGGLQHHLAGKFLFNNDR